MDEARALDGFAPNVDSTFSALPLLANMADADDGDELNLDLEGVTPGADEVKVTEELSIPLELNSRKVWLVKVRPSPSSALALKPWSFIDRLDRSVGSEVPPGALGRSDDPEPAPCHDASVRHVSLRVRSNPCCRPS